MTKNYILSRFSYHSFVNEPHFPRKAGLVGMVLFSVVEVWLMASLVSTSQEVFQHGVSSEDLEQHAGDADAEVLEARGE